MIAKQRPQLTAEQLEEFVGKLYSISYSRRGEPFEEGSWLTWEDALYNVGSEIGRLTPGELDEVHQLCICETEWDKGQGQGIASRAVSTETFDWAE